MGDCGSHRSPRGGTNGRERSSNSHRNGKPDCGSVFSRCEQQSRLFSTAARVSPRLIPLEGAAAEWLAPAARAIGPIRDRARSEFLGVASHRLAIAATLRRERARTKRPGLGGGAVRPAGDRGDAMPARGGVGSAAANWPAMNPNSMEADRRCVRRDRSGLRMERSLRLRDNACGGIIAIAGGLWWAALSDRTRSCLV